MQVFYGDNLGRSMEGNDKNEFFIVWSLKILMV
jgi:hypothetical protein